MRAYAMIAPFQENFSTTELKDRLKKHTRDFGQLRWEQDRYGALMIALETGEALYLYGGRDALREALKPLIGGYVRDKGDGQLILFRAQRATKSMKAKQMLMLTRTPTSPSDKLTSRLVRYQKLHIGSNTADHHRVLVQSLRNAIAELDLLKEK